MLGINTSTQNTLSFKSSVPSSKFDVAKFARLSAIELKNLTRDSFERIYLANTSPRNLETSIVPNFINTTSEKLATQKAENLKDYLI